MSFVWRREDYTWLLSFLRKNGNRLIVIDNIIHSKFAEPTSQNFQKLNTLTKAIYPEILSGPWILYKGPILNSYSKKPIPNKNAILSQKMPAHGLRHLQPSQKQE